LFSSLYWLLAIILSFTENHADADLRTLWLPSTRRWLPEAEILKQWSRVRWTIPLMFWNLQAGPFSCKT
jgi:hypothetical protein